MVKREKEKKKKEGKNISGRKLLRIPFVQGGRDRSITKKTRFRIHTDPGFLSLSILTARSFEKMMTKSFCRFTDASPEKCQPGCDYPNETKKKRKKKKKEGERGLKKRRKRRDDQGDCIYICIYTQQQQERSSAPLARNCFCTTWRGKRNSIESELNLERALYFNFYST